MAALIPCLGIYPAVLRGGADLLLHGKVGESGFPPVRGVLSKDMVCRCLHDPLFLLVSRAPFFSSEAEIKFISHVILYDDLESLVNYY